jgi:DNA modification methylase
MIFNGDCIEILPTLEANSIQCVVTSPPYYGLRDYGCEGQIGLEATPEAYVEKLVAVFREVKRVLRPDGCVFLNLGDSYASGKGTCYNPGGGSSSLGKERKEYGAHPLDRGNKSTLDASGLKPKDLIGIPWRVAFALQADGWYLRQDIIWAKPNPMPESVKDRCCKSHEYIFLLTKSAKYFYDAEAVKEPATFAGKNRGVSKNVSVTGISDFGGNIQYADRNKRSVWTINTRSFKEAHFATFPPEIPTICIKAGTSEKGCCPECGIPWERVMEKVGQVKQKWGHTDAPDCRPGNENGTGDKGLRDGMVNVKETTGWRPTCTHSLEPIPCTVLDPFAGAGTTGMIAEKLDRKFIGIELNPEYAKMGERRIEAAWLPLFANLSTIGREG